jgi:hypothetical protein
MDEVASLKAVLQLPNNDTIMNKLLPEFATVADLWQAH